LISGGVGIVGFGVATGFGLSARATYSESEPECSATNVCTPRGLDLRDSAYARSTVATVAFGVGVAGAVGAVALWLTAPAASRAPEEAPPATARIGFTPAVDGLPWTVSATGAW
jgi:hypothetical protein